MDRDFERVLDELSQAVRLDKHDLDNQLTEHPELVRQVHDYLALYTAQRDAAKRNVEEMEAKVASEVRDDAAASKEKVTVDDVKQRVVLDDRVVGAKDKLAELTFTVKRIDSLVIAYDHRRHAFQKLVDLYNGQYWSTTSGGGSRVQARERVEAEIRKSSRRERVT